MVARAATSASGTANGPNARPAATAELPFMRIDRRQPPMIRLLLKGEKHVLPSSHPLCCLQTWLGGLGRCAFRLGKSMCCWVPNCCLQLLGPLAAHPLAQFGSVWGFSGLECFWLSLAPYLCSCLSGPRPCFGVSLCWTILLI